MLRASTCARTLDEACLEISIGPLDSGSTVENLLKRSFILEGNSEVIVTFWAVSKVLMNW